ncbi:MAG: TorF family putative porin [Halioglobus sp.]|nr:TorF family putative porin [Halioglobus sp.]
MLNKKLLPVAVAAALTGGFSATQAQAEVEVSGNVALTSDYRFRGISQSDESVAVQGGFDLGFENGIYIGTWGSSVDFDDSGNLGSLELDYYVGWASDIGDSGFGIDIGYFYYDYPGDDGDSEGDYQEFAATVSFGDLGVGIVYSDDYYAGTDEFWYLSADYGFAISDAFSLGFHLGYNMLEETKLDSFGNVTDGGFLSSDEDQYYDYSVTATYSVAGVDLSLAYIGTDLDDDDVFGTDWADDTAVISISKSL